MSPARISVGFSPLLSAPSGEGELGADDLNIMLEQMIQCGQEFERRVEAGQRGRDERHQLGLRFAPGVSGYAFTFG